VPPHGDEFAEVGGPPAAHPGGQDGPGRPRPRAAKVIATAFADLGFDVDIGPLFQTPAEVARRPWRTTCTWWAQLAGRRPQDAAAAAGAELAALGREDIMVVVGGVIPPRTTTSSTRHGAAAIFGPRAPSSTDLFLVLLLPASGDDLQGIKRGVMELADLVAVNKADGDTRAAALRTRAEMAAALHMGAGGERLVLTCSAATGEGLDEVWEAVRSRHEEWRRDGRLAARRLDQEVRGFRLRVEEAVLERVLGEGGPGSRAAPPGAGSGRRLAAAGGGPAPPAGRLAGVNFPHHPTTSPTRVSSSNLGLDPRTCEHALGPISPGRRRCPARSP
jgi:methylmalonyl-CoA mutase cobalamin-binding domain/chain